MYNTSLNEVISIIAKEQAYRELSRKTIETVSNSKNIAGKKVKEIILEKMSEIETRGKYLENLIIEDYNKFFMNPCYSLFVNENTYKNLKTIRETEDYLLIDFETDEHYPYFEIQKYKTLEEVEESILERGSIESIEKLIVLEKGKVKDFDIALSRKTPYLPIVRWFENEYKEEF